MYGLMYVLIPAFIFGATIFGVIQQNKHSSGDAKNDDVIQDRDVNLNDAINEEEKPKNDDNENLSTNNEPLSQEPKMNGFQIGRNYEYKIKCYLQKQGFKVFPNGLVNGRNDDGIDLIAYKDNEVHLIQCKCYKYPPKQDLIRKFYGDCKIYEEKNNLGNKKIVYRFITSCRTIDYGTNLFLSKNKFISYEIINV